MPNKMGSNRIGWNQRGPTTRDQVAWAKQQSEINNPESYYWQQQTFIVKDLLIKAIGEDAFIAFADCIFPGKTIDDYSWQQIHDTYDAKLARVKTEQLEQEASKWIS